MARWKAASSFTATQRSLVAASDKQPVEPGQLWVYVLTATICCVTLVYWPHRTYKNGMRPDSGLDRSPVENVQVKLFSMQKAGMALEQMSRIASPRCSAPRRNAAPRAVSMDRWKAPTLHCITACHHAMAGCR
eukprot:3869454-Prymnesium_polylepis.1